jgi:hypothetical protein
VRENIRTEPAGLRRNQLVWYRTGRFGTKPAGSVLNRSAGSVFQPVRPGQASNRSNRPVSVSVCRFLKLWAEYIALSVAVREAVWLCKLLKDLFDHETDPTTIHCDNQSCVKLSENPVFHNRSKHIEIKYHYIRDMMKRKAVHVQYFPTHELIVDIFTKPLANTKFEYFHKNGLVENTSLAEREC